MWYNSNDTSSKELSSNRENIKKEFTNNVEQVVQKESLSENVSTTQVKQAFREDQKPSNPSCSTDEIGISIDESLAVRFRNNLFVVSIANDVFNLRSFPSIALRIPTAHNVTRD